MPWVYIEDLGGHLGAEVTLKGWLYNRRSSGKVHFLLIRDGTGVCQCVASINDLGAEAFATADHLGQETSLEVTGVVREDKRAPGGRELTITGLKVLAPSIDYPITPKEHGPAFLLDLRHLWVRSARQHAILRIRSEVEAACRDFFHERGFVLFDSPILTPTSCEGTTNLFEIDYFGERKAYLTQSGQLYAEAGALAFGKVYCFGPTFRAEKSKTRRHLTEFWMVEPEVAYFDARRRHATGRGFRRLHRRARARAAPRRIEGARARHQPSSNSRPSSRIRGSPMTRRSNGSRRKGFEVNWGDDLGGDEETALSAEFVAPVLVHRYPAAAKPFYMKQDPAASGSRAMRRYAGARRLRRDHRRRSARGRLRDAEAADRRARPAARAVQLVPRFAPLRIGAARGLRDGYRALRRMDCGTHHVREAMPFPRMMERLEP